MYTAMPAVSKITEDCSNQQQQPDRILAQASLGDGETTEDEACAERTPEQTPGLYGHEIQPVRVQQGHERTGEEVVEAGKGDQRQQSRYTAHHPHSASNVDLVLLGLQVGGLRV
jgi:hypothetical protein